ncbi:hypothetical protein GCK32_005028 [Trichostrongylus colubriformis]|uniref:C2H2-type domain-containing protein n=1 Tax=Trichostrongylus colubriformis TaxID=6319 RepID=A0AAN8IHN6_TRICO
MRHIGRRHTSQYRDGLEDKIATNKWRTEKKPIEVDLPKKFDEDFPSAQQCGDLVPRLLCVHCGATFDNRTDLDRHVTNTHRSFKCQHCGEISNGYASLKAHEMRQRAQAFVCSCGASFSRQSELRAHRNACRKRGSFLCLVCERLFTQRVQLDRYWKKEHFVNAQCTECGWIAAAPLRKAEHALEVDKNYICGYCGVEEPSIDHVSAEHLKRLKESISVRQTNKKQDRSSSSRSDTSPSEPTDAPFNVEEDQKQPREEALRREAFPVIRPVGADAKADRLLSEYFWLIFQDFGSISFNSNGALKSRELPEPAVVSMDDTHVDLLLGCLEWFASFKGYDESSHATFEREKELTVPVEFFENASHAVV